MELVWQGGRGQGRQRYAHTGNQRQGQAAPVSPSSSSSSSSSCLDIPVHSEPRASDHHVRARACSGVPPPLPPPPLILHPPPQPRSVPSTHTPPQPLSSNQPSEHTLGRSQPLSTPSTPKRAHTFSAPLPRPRSSRNKVGASLLINTARMDGARVANHPPPQHVPDPAQTAGIAQRLVGGPCYGQSSIHDGPAERDEGPLPSCLGLHIDLRGHDLPTSQIRVDLSELSARSAMRHQQLQQLHGRVAATLDLAANATAHAAASLRQPSPLSGRPASASSQRRGLASNLTSPNPESFGAAGGANPSRQRVGRSASAGSSAGHVASRFGLREGLEQPAGVPVQLAQPQRPHGSQVALLAANASARRRADLARTAAAVVAADQAHGSSNRMFQRLRGTNATAGTFWGGGSWSPSGAVLEALQDNVQGPGEQGSPSQEDVDEHDARMAEKGVEMFSCIARKHEEDICCICLQVMTVGERVRMLGCGHTLHHPCLFQLVWGQTSCVCPICRTVFSGE